MTYGADPRCEDEDGTTPFELAKDDATRSALHDAVIESDAKRDLVGMYVRTTVCNLQWSLIYPDFTLIYVCLLNGNEYTFCIPIQKVTHFRAKSRVFLWPNNGHFPLTK